MRPELEAALAAVAAAQAASAEGGAEKVTSKGGRDLVTAADVASEDAIRRELLRRYPAYPVVGEERGGEPPQDGGPYWLVDPICGTGVIYTAERGGGAWVRAAAGMAPPLAPLSVREASSVLWVDTATTRSGDWSPHAGRFISAALLADRWYVWVFGSSLALAYLAGGRIAGWVHFHVSSPLHTAAGCLLAQEADAIATDFDGRPWTLESTGLVFAATPQLHRDLLSLVAETGSAVSA